MTDKFDEKLNSLVDDMPPAPETVNSVNPWKNAMRKMVWGICLTLGTFNFPVIGVILSSLAVILIILGVRSLKTENSAFKTCYVVSLIKLVKYVLGLALEACCLNITEFADKALYPIALFGALLDLILLINFRRGVLDVKRKAGYEAGGGGFLALIIWYIVLLAIALLGGAGLIGWILFISYIFIVISIVKFTKGIEGAGYELTPAELKYPDSYVFTACAVLMLTVIFIGNLCFSRLPMQWEAASETPAYDEEIAESLKNLGFPESILKDLSSEDIAQCEGADMVRVSSYIHDNNYNSYRYYLDSEYKTAENGTCTVAHIAVRIPTEINGTEWYRWYVINYFIWPGENNFKGNELMWLTTLYNRGTFDVVTYPFEGRVLYDDGETTYVSAFNSIGKKYVQTNGIFSSGGTNALDIAMWSFPGRVSNARGYITYIAENIKSIEINENAIINYYHQKNAIIFPLTTPVKSGDVYNWKNTSAYILFNDLFLLNTEGKVY